MANSTDVVRFSAGPYAGDPLNWHPHFLYPSSTTAVPEVKEREGADLVEYLWGKEAREQWLSGLRR